MLGEWNRFLDQHAKEWAKPNPPPQSFRHLSMHRLCILWTLGRNNRALMLRDEWKKIMENKIICFARCTCLYKSYSYDSRQDCFPANSNPGSERSMDFRHFECRSGQGCSASKTRFASCWTVGMILSVQYVCTLQCEHNTSEPGKK